MNLLTAVNPNGVKPGYIGTMTNKIPLRPAPSTVEHSQAHPAAALIDYQVGAVVSREILRKKTGTVTMFAFDSGQGLSEHTAPFDALVHVLDGEAEITVGGQSRRVTASELMIMPAHVPHALEAVQRFKMMLVMIRSE
jgi:quercetin dioxygenase-like cupin family protein